MTKKSGTEGVTLHLNILSLSIFIHHLSFSVSLSSVSLFHNPVPPATISIHNHHIHPPSPQPQTTAKKKKPSTSKATKSKNHPNQRITKSKKSSKSTNHNKDPKPLRSTHSHLWTTPINPQTQPPKSRTHQNQSKPLKLKLTDIKMQNPLTEPSQRPTTNHYRDPRSTKNHRSPTTPSITSRPHLRPTNSRSREKRKQRGREKMKERVRRSGRRARDRRWHVGMEIVQRLAAACGYGDSSKIGR